MSNIQCKKLFVICIILSVIFAGIFFSFREEQFSKSTQSVDNQSKILLYVKKNCIYCQLAKNLLTDIGLDYEAIDLSDNQDLHLKMINKTGQHTVPYIFIDDEFVGGYTEFKNLVKEQKL